MDLPMRMDYYGGDFVEDGSFLVLSTDGSSLSPGTPPVDKPDEEGKPIDIEELNGMEEEEEEMHTPNSSMIRSTVQSPQVLGEDPESSASSSRTSSLKQGNSGIGTNGTGEGDAVVPDNLLTSMKSMSSVSSSSTEAHLSATNEEISLLMNENKKLTELLADSNEKMKQCIITTEKLKTDHEEYKKKNEASREAISQLRIENDNLRAHLTSIQAQLTEKVLNDEKEQVGRQGSLDRQSQIITELNGRLQTLLSDNEKLQAQLTSMQIQLAEKVPSAESDQAGRQDSLQRQSQTITELNERLETVLIYNGKLNDQLLSSQKHTEELRKAVEKLEADKLDTDKRIETMVEELEAGRQTVEKFSEHHRRLQVEVGGANQRIVTLQAELEEKTKLTDSLRRNMEDTVTALEKRNQRLNQKEHEISLLTTKLAALNAETEVSDQVQALLLQCQETNEEVAKLREERSKLVAEKDVVITELNARNEQLKQVSDAFDNYRRQNDGNSDRNSRNDNTVDNANDSLPSPVTSLPSVAGLVGFVRREILGWEVQTGNAGDSLSNIGAAAPATVVQQPKQDALPPCPLCRRTFTSLEALQTHASNCGIENDGQPEDPFVFP